MARRRLGLPDLVVPLAGPQAVVSSRTGPKAATLAKLHRAGLPVPGGFCVVADAYRTHLAAAGLTEVGARVARQPDGHTGRSVLAVRLGLLEAPLEASLAQGLDAAYARLASESGPLVAVRSSASRESGPATSYAGQLETLLGVAGPHDLMTAVRACWASLWSPRALRYMQTRDVDPARTAMAVLVQPLVRAHVSGGALSRTLDDRHLVLTATWGLGPTVAQGQVVPDRYLLRRDGPLLESVEPGRKDRLLAYSPEQGLSWQGVPPASVAAPCLSEAEAVTLARLVLTVEAALGRPVEIEWASDEQGVHLLQARPLTIRQRRPATRPRRGHPRLEGQPAGAGSAVGPARIVRREADLAAVGPGEVLVTRVSGPAVAEVLPRVAAVVTELGGSTSHLAALARERRIPAVLGVADATRRIADGVPVIVDGAEGVVYDLPPQRRRPRGPHDSSGSVTGWCNSAERSAASVISIT